MSATPVITTSTDIHKDMNDDDDNDEDDNEGNTKERNMWKNYELPQLYLLVWNRQKGKNNISGWQLDYN